MLPGVEGDLVDPRVAQRERERRGLDELRSVPDDGEDLHAGKPTRLAMRSLPGRRLPWRQPKGDGDGQARGDGVPDARWGRAGPRWGGEGRVPAGRLGVP